MCNFLSALVLRSGEIVCDTEHTDSHEDLIDAFGLEDNGRGGFVRVEFTPPSADAILDPDMYALRVDQGIVPEWFTKAMRDTTTNLLRDRVRRMIVKESRKLLLGGCWILVGGASVGTIRDSRILTITGDARVSRIAGDAKVDEITGDAKVDTITGDARVSWITGDTKVDTITGDARVSRIAGYAKVVNDRRNTRGNVHG